MLAMMVEITTPVTQGLLKDLPVGDHRIFIPDASIILTGRATGNTGNRDYVKVALTSDTPQFISEGDEIDGVTINRLQARIR